MKFKQSIFLLLAALGACQKDAGTVVTSDTAAYDQVKATAGSSRREMAAPAAVAPAPPPIMDAAVEQEASQVRGQVAGFAAPGRATDPFQSINVGTGAPSMVIRTGQAFIEVEKVDPAILKIRQLAARVGGYIANSSVSGGRDQIRQATLELKIPSAQYDQAVGDLSTIGKVETVSSNAQDVGEEFVDVTARVNNAKKLEDRLINLLANRTGKLDEVLRVERELARVREEIERYEGRLRYLSTRAAMSTLTITVHEPAPILGNDPGSNPIVAALRRAWRNFVGLVAGLIASLGVLIPLALVGWAGWVWYRRWKKNRN